MLPKAHVTSHSRMSGSRWLIPSWLSRSWRSFLYSSSVYSCHLFLISSASVRSIPFLSFIEPIFAWNVPLVSPIFLKSFLVFPILMFSSFSLCWSPRKAFWSPLAILWNSEFKCIYLSFSALPFASILLSVICKDSSDNYFAFLHFFFLGMVLITASCTTLRVHSSSGTLSIRSNTLNLFLIPLYHHKGFDLGHTRIELYTWIKSNFLQKNIIQSRIFPKYYQQYLIENENPPDMGKWRQV